MNEKIRELAEQAGYGRERWNTMEQFEQFMEKFAELIVKECSHLVFTRDQRREPAEYIYLLKVFDIK